MEATINLIEKIFSTNYFNDTYIETKGTFSDFYTVFKNNNIVFEYKNILNTVFYSNSKDEKILSYLDRFFRFIDINFQSITTVNVSLKNMKNCEGYKINLENITFFLPLEFFRKLIFLLSKRDINKITEDKYFSLFELIEDDFIMLNRDFPFKINDFLLSYNDIDMQRVINIFLSNNLCDAKMINIYAKSDETGRIQKNIPASIISHIQDILFTPQYLASVDFLLKSNFGQITNKLNNLRLNDFQHFKQTLFDDEIMTFINTDLGIEILEKWQKNGLFMRAFSSIDNKDLAILLKSNFNSLVEKNCSKNRIMMIKEDKEYKNVHPEHVIRNKFSIIINNCFNTEFLSQNNKLNLFKDFLRGIYGKRDFEIIFSRMNPIDFAICFYLSSDKVKNYILSHINSPGKEFLNNFFSEEIRPLTPINKGWFNNARTSFSNITYFLIKLNKVKWKNSD